MGPAVFKIVGPGASTGDGGFDSLALPPALPVPTSRLGPADGTALREAWRQFLHASVMPVSLSVSAELSEKLDAQTRLSFDRMFASDLSGRARAFQSMVGGGMPVDKAAALPDLSTLPNDVPTGLHPMRRRNVPKPRRRSRMHQLRTFSRSSRPCAGHVQQRDLVRPASCPRSTGPGRGRSHVCSV